MNMKKKIFVISSITITVALILILTIIFLTKSNEDLLPFISYTSDNLITSLTDENSLDDNLPTVVLFHTKMCKTCVEFKPYFEKMAKKYKGKYNFAELEVQDPANYPLSAIYGMAVPNLYIFDTKIGNKIHISLNDARSISGIELELDRYLRIRSFIDLKKANEEHIRRFNEYQEKLQKAKK